jgi:hypothetical protein
MSITSIELHLVLHVNSYLPFYDKIKMCSLSKHFNEMSDEIIYNAHEIYTFSLLKFSDINEIKQSMSIYVFYFRRLYFITSYDFYHNYINLRNLELVKSQMEINDMSTDIIDIKINELFSSFSETEKSGYTNHLFYSISDDQGRKYYTLKKDIDMRFFGYSTSTPYDIIDYEEDMNWVSGDNNSLKEEDLGSVRNFIDFKYYIHEDGVYRKMIEPAWYREIRKNYTLYKNM